MSESEYVPSGSLLIVRDGERVVAQGTGWLLRAGSRW